MRTAAALAAACLAQPALAQWGLHGFTDNGLIYQIDEFTGNRVLVGDLGTPIIGVSRLNGFFKFAALTADDRIIAINFRDYSTTPLITLTGRPAGYTPVAFMYWYWPAPSIRIVLDAPTGEDIMFQVDPATGVYERVGTTGLHDVVDYNGWLLTESGSVYWNPSPQQWVFRFRVEVNEPLRAMSGSYCAIYSGQGLFLGTNYTGAVTQIVATGFEDIAALVYHNAWNFACNLDTTTGIAVCDVFDFLMFQHMWISEDPFACDCDTNSGPGVCDIFDFLCFQNAFAEGMNAQSRCR
jgi:hypothetical protein